MHPESNEFELPESFFILTKSQLIRLFHMQSCRFIRSGETMIVIPRHLTHKQGAELLGMNSTHITDAGNMIATAEITPIIQLVIGEESLQLPPYPEEMNHTLDYMQMMVEDVSVNKHAHYNSTVLLDTVCARR